MAKERDVFLSCVDSSGATDLQGAYLPVPLMQAVPCAVTGYVRVNLDTSASLICNILPVANSYCDEGYQVVACNCVSVGGKESHTKGPKGDYRVTPAEVAPLKIVNPAEIKITVVVNSVEDVLKYRQNRGCYEKSLKDLIGLYGIVEKSTINCHSNPLARLLGVSQIIVENCPSQLQEVCVITAGTEIIVNNVESQDRKRLMVRNRVNLGGLDAVLTYLRRIIREPWDRRLEFEEAGASYPSGVLMVGPPGCGKTSVVREVCAETGASLVATAAAEIASPYPGHSERSFAKVAERARGLSEEGPCIFFIDEIDSLCPARTTNTPLSAITLTTQILLEMDKCHQCPSLTLMAATNRPYDLDLGVRRSGRLEVEILLNVPSATDRANILRVHTSDLLPASHPGLEDVARCSPGLVGADIQALVQATRADMAAKKKEGKAAEDPDSVVRFLLSNAANLTPSIHKTLEFITARPQGVGGEVGGLQGVKRELEQIFEQHTRYAHAYKILKLRRPRGVLLYGPRGCGKTRLVASLAKNRGCTFLSATASHLLSPYVGESEKRVAALFHAARLAQPTILFIDEIDGIFGRRDGGASNTSVSLLTELLQAMDGADQGAASLQGASLLSQSNASTCQDGVLVCAATNHPRRLDPALLRPGRLDRLVYIPLPDRQARLDILKVKTSRLELESTKVLEQLADKTKGFTGAELESLVMKAVKKSIQKKQYDPKTLVPQVGWCDLLPSSGTLPSPATTTQEIKAYKEFQRSVGGSRAPVDPT